MGWLGSAQDFFVDATIQKAETLPAQAFWDNTVLEKELDTIFANHWLMLPQKSSSELRQDARSLQEMVQLRGAHFPLYFLNKPLFLQRSWESQLYCFPNICTHAWFPIVQGPGREKILMCDQHGRKFNTDGTYASQPGFSPHSENFPRPCDHLEKLPIAEWGPFFFMSFRSPQTSFSDLIQPIEAIFPAWNWHEWKRMPQLQEEREVEGNWKQHAWNYMDKFHITFIHRAPHGLADAVDMSSYQTELYEDSALQWVYSKNPDLGFAPEQVAERFRDPDYPEKRVFALWWFIFPNLTLNFYPWGLSINLYYPVPGKPEKTLFLWYHYLRDEAKYHQRNELWLNEQVDQEDVDAMAQVRRALNSRLAVRGRFAPTEEKGPHWFHRKVYTSLFP